MKKKRIVFLIFLYVNCLLIAGNNISVEDKNMPAVKEILFNKQAMNETKKNKILNMLYTLTFKQFDGLSDNAYTGILLSLFGGVCGFSFLIKLL